jgi:hypothetical protein
MKKLKGPDLKMPDLKVPGFVSDLYYDLRDRRLLPLVGLVLVAIVAVPFLLSSDPEESGPPRITGPGAGSTSVNTSQLTVVPATPGLRDYRKRLRSRSPKDPFRQPAVQPDLSDAQLGSKGDNGFESTEVTTSTSTSTGSTEADTTETTKTTKSKDGDVTTETTTETSEEPDAEGLPGSGEHQFFVFAIDVRIKKTTTAADGSSEVKENLTRSHVLAPAPLPGEKTQVVTFMGINLRTGNALLMVSDEVSSVFGEAKCLSGDRSCQLLEVEKGIPTTFVYGPGNARYKITVLKSTAVPVDKP